MYISTNSINRTVTGTLHSHKHNLRTRNILCDICKFYKEQKLIDTTENQLHSPGSIEQPHCFYCLTPDIWNGLLIPSSVTGRDYNANGGRVSRVSQSLLNKMQHSHRPLAIFGPQPLKVKEVDLKWHWPHSSCVKVEGGVHHLTCYSHHHAQLSATEPTRLEWMQLNLNPKVNMQLTWVINCVKYPV